MNSPDKSHLTRPVLSFDFDGVINCSVVDTEPTSFTDPEQTLSLFRKHKDSTRFLYISNGTQNKEDIQIFLEADGYEYAEAMMYKSSPADISDTDIQDFDMLVLFSPSSVASLFDSYPKFKQQKVRIAVYGKATADAILDCGLSLHVMAPLHDSHTIVKALDNYLSVANKPSVIKAKQAATKVTSNGKDHHDNGLINRYSDADLKEFKEIIEKKLRDAHEELRTQKDALDRCSDSPAGNQAWNMTEGSDTSEMEYLMNQIARLNKFIRDLEMALVRIENKTYGICRLTGKLIDKERLRKVPHATLSLVAKNSGFSD